MVLLKEASGKIKKYAFLDLIRKMIYVIIRYFSKGIHFLRKWRFYFYTRCWVENIGGKVFFSSVAMNTTIGENANFYPSVVLELAESAELTIGSHFTLSYGSIIACTQSVQIGDFVMVGEYSSIRDTSHKHDYSPTPYCKQGDIAEKIIIGNNVWIGRGCIILPGATIEDGVIIGAHSVVKGRLKANCMYAGTPAKIIKDLTAVNAYP